MARKFYIESLGCAKNQVDSEVIIENLLSDGWERVLDPASADAVLVNSCGFIQSAKEESLGAVFSLRAQAPKAKLVLCGCLAQRYADDLAGGLPEADGIFGNRDLGRAGGFLASLMDGSGPAVLVPPFPQEEFDRRSVLLGWPGSAYLKISEGCSHRCAYCAIPIIRGPLRSRPEEAILRDARSLAARGIREINIIAQDLAAYGTDLGRKDGLVDLLEKIAAVEGDFRLRLLYIHPDSFPPALLDLARSEPKILPYFDIPIQHASTSILRSMGRKGDAAGYAALVARIREALPEAVVRTTLMVGYPGETEEDFETLISFVRECQFDWMGSFVYSREEGTAAWGLTDVAGQKAMEKAALRRQRRLQKIQEAITAERLERFVGREFDVLIEERFDGQEEGGGPLALGRIYSQAPEVDGQTVVSGDGLVPGSVCRCRVIRTAGVDLDAVKIDG